MVSKVTRSARRGLIGHLSAAAAGPQLKRFEDLPSVLAKTKSYPTPVRMVGADYSQTRCVGGDGGTTVDTGALDKILEFGETLRAGPGRRARGQPWCRRWPSAAWNCR